MVVLQGIADIHNDCWILDDIIHKKDLYNLNSIDNWVMLRTNPWTVIILHLSISLSMYLCGTQIAFDFTAQNISHSWRSTILLKINLEAYLKFKHVYELELQWYKT